jgi:hypothetical protein
MHFLCAFELGACSLWWALPATSAFPHLQVFFFFNFSMMYLIEQKISSFLFYFYFLFGVEQKPSSTVGSTEARDTPSFSRLGLASVT